MELDLSGKSVLISGSSKGIGLACAHAFAAQGCDLHLVACDADALEAAREDHMARRGVTASSSTTSVPAARSWTTATWPERPAIHPSWHSPRPLAADPCIREYRS